MHDFDGKKARGLAHLYRRTGELTAFALWLTDGNKHDADDLVQETFLKAWKSKSDFDVEWEKVKGLVWEIMKKARIDILRKQGRRISTQGMPEGWDRPTEDMQRHREPWAERVLDVIKGVPKEYLNLLLATDHDRERTAAALETTEVYVRRNEQRIKAQILDAYLLEEYFRAIDRYNPVCLGANPFEVAKGFNYRYPTLDLYPINPLDELRAHTQFTTQQKLNYWKVRSSHFAWYENSGMDSPEYTQARCSGHHHKVGSREGLLELKVICSWNLVRDSSLPLTERKQSSEDIRWYLTQLWEFDGQSVIKLSPEERQRFQHFTRQVEESLHELKMGGRKHM